MSIPFSLSLFILHSSFFISQGASGFRRSQLSCGRMLRLASRGFGNRQIAFTPCPFGVHAPTRRLLSSFRKPAAHSRRLIGLSSVPRSARHRRHGCFSPQAHSLRLRGEYAARLTPHPVSPAHPLRSSPTAASVRLASPRAKPPQALHAKHL